MMEWITNSQKGTFHIISGALIGRPKATENFSVEQLEGFNYVGIYRTEPNPRINFDDSLVRCNNAQQA